MNRFEVIIGNWSVWYNQAYCYIQLENDDKLRPSEKRFWAQLYAVYNAERARCVRRAILVSTKRTRNVTQGLVEVRDQILKH